jgi:hypothetical protein
MRHPAPWNPTEVHALNQLQSEPLEYVFQPFSCPTCQVSYVATVIGFVCPMCGAGRDWVDDRVTEIAMSGPRQRPLFERDFQ